MTALAERTIEFIDAFVRENGYSPSYAEIGAAIGLRSKSGIHRVITELERDGRIRRLPTRWRAIEVVKPEPALNGSDGPFAALIMAFFPEIGMTEGEAHGLSRQTRINSRKPPRHPYSHEIPHDLRIVKPEPCA